MSRGNRRNVSKSGRLGKSDNPNGKNPNAEQNRHDTSQDVQRTANDLPIVQKIHADVTGHVACQKDGQEQQQRKPFWNSGAFREWVLITVATATCAVMVWQNDLTRRAVVATEDANEISRQTFKAGQRAWISSKDAQLGEIDRAGNKATWYIANLENVGGSPAFKVRISVKTGVADISFGDLKDKTAALAQSACAEAEKDISENIFFPKQNYFRSGPITKTNDNIPFLAGCVLYESLGVSHAFTFCHFWAPDPGAQASKWQSRMCPDGHHAD